MTKRLKSTVLGCIFTRKKYFTYYTVTARNSIHPNNKQKPEITNKNTGKRTSQYDQPG